MSMQGGDEMELGKQIKMHRQEVHLSQSELANRVYVSRQTISNWENDKSYPDVNSLVLLSEIFQISLDNLIKGDIEVMKDVIQKEEIEKMNRYGKSYTIMLIATAVSAVPLFMWLGVWAFIPWGTFAKMELTKLPSLISEVQHHIDNINQKELFASDDTTKLLVNEAMEDITFNFSKISEEELKIVGGKDAVTEKYKKTVRAFTQNIDPDDPEFITLQEAFLLRFKQHGFEPKSVSEIEEQGKELEDILKKLDELQKKNTVLLRKYNGDAKFARVHKRIREENLARKAANKQPIVSEYDMSIMNVLLSIKSDIDQKVYDRNDILKKDAYFERTVMTQIKAGIDKLGVASAREDRVFIQSRITKQYLDQYNQTYSVA